MQSAKETRRRRRRYIIDPAFQWKFGAWLMADVFVVCLFMGMLLLVVQGGYMRSVLLEARAVDWAEMTVMLIVFALGFAVVAGGAFGLWSVMFTHRLCGPLHILGLRLGELAKGRFPKWRPLRKKDECKELYAQFWDAVDSLKASKQADFDALTEILSALKSAATDDNPNRRTSLEAVAARLAAMRRTAAEALAIECDDVSAPSKPTQAPRPDAVALCGPRGGEPPA